LKLKLLREQLCRVVVDDNFLHDQSCLLIVIGDRAARTLPIASVMLLPF
jgi:hypothetical protein